MKKIVNIFLAVLITLFSFPIGSVNVSAAEKVYDDIADGEHSVKVELLTKGTEDTSIADQYINEDAKLNIKDGKAEIVLSIPNLDGFKFSAFEIEGNEYNKQTAGEVSYYKFNLSEVKSKLAAVVTYELTRPFEFKHSDVPMDIKVLGLDSLPKIEKEEPTPENPQEPEQPEETEKPEEEPTEPGEGSNDGEAEKPEEEKPKPEPAPEKRVVGELISEEDADEVYTVDFDSDSRATKGQLENPTKLLVKGDKEYIQIPVNEVGAPIFRSLKFNGEEVTWNSITEGPYIIQYELVDGIEGNIDVSMVIQAGPNAMPHDGIKLWFDEKTLKMTKVKDKRITGEILTEEEAESVQLYDYGTDSRATAGQFKNPVKVLEKENEKYLQIEVNGAQYFRSLQFDGKEVIWNSLDQAPNIIQYKLDSDELPVGEDDSIDVSMIIDTGRAVMPHADIDFWLANTVSNIELGKATKVDSNDRIVIGDTGNYLKTPVDLPNNVSLTIKSDAESVKKFGNNQGLTVAGEVYDFTFENLTSNFGSFELVMEYDADKYNENEYEIDIYYLNEKTKEWEPQNGDAKNGLVSVNVDHFSTYGVFAKEKPEEVANPEEPKEDPKDKEDPKEEPKEEAILTPDKAYEINYTILNENGKTASVADGFFVKPGKLLEKDGKTYFQLTVENAKMVKSLSNKYGDYILVNEKDGTKTMQLRVPNDLSDMDLDMHIVVSGVPGFPGYDSKHDAILSFDKNSKKSISVEDVELVASGDKENENGPFVEGTEPVKPTPNPTPKPTPGKPAPDPTPEPEPGKDKVNLTPDKAYEINYTILQENGKDVSVADDFFVKPGKLLVKDGKTYFQMTVGSADMVKSLSNKYGDYIIVSNNKDGSMTMQIRVPNDLSDIALDMHIVVPAGAVPGFPGYDSKHGAILTFDLASKKEISVEGLEVVASGDKDNENGPYVEGATPGKPAFGDNGNENEDKKFGKNGNPQTGDTSQIFFFASLLMASLAVLVLQLRRRLAA